MNEIMHIHDEAPAYALNALPPVDHTAVEGHASQCDPCRATLNEAVEAAQMLAFVATPVVPPKHCKSAVMQRIEREAFLSKPTRRPTSRLATFAVAAAAFTLLTIWNVRMQSQVSAGLTTIATIEVELADARQEVQAMEAALQEDATAQAFLLGAQATRVLEPRGTGAPTAKAKMYMSPGETTGMIVIQDLPPAPAGKVYRVWVAREGVRAPCATLDGHKTRVMVQAPEALDSYSWVMIKLEASDLAPQPDAEDVLWGEF